MVFLLELPIYLPYGAFIFSGISYVLIILFNNSRRYMYDFSLFKSFILSTFPEVFGILSTIIFFWLENTRYFPTLGFSFFGIFYIFPFLMLISKLFFKKESYFKIMSFIAPDILLQVAIMRINCTLSGCCYGIESDFGIFYGQVKRFPVQLMECLMDFFAFILILIIEKKSKLKLNNFSLVLLFYGIIRTICELFRDSEKNIGGFLSNGQLLAIIAIVLALLMIFAEFIFSVKKKKIKDIT